VKPGALDLAEQGHPAPEGCPEVTVIIPTRDRRAFLRQSVNDALRQEDVDLEVVIVDDGSTTADSLRDVESLDPRIRIVRHATRRGPACARNTGINNARGKWVAFFDDDDRWSPLKLRKQLDAATASGTSWGYAGALTIDAEDRVLSAAAAPDEASIMHSLLQFNGLPGGCSNVIAKADVIRAVGGFDERLSLIADWDLWIRLAEAGPPAACDEFLIGYRLHGDNMHVRDVDAIYGEFAYMAAKYPATRLGQPLHPDLSSSALAWQAQANRRAGNRGAAAHLYLRRLRLTHDPADLVRVAAALLGERVIRALLRRRSRRLRPLWPDSGR
jgi:glycosyltransferase involved in cell wall biosynthesis